MSGRIICEFCSSDILKKFRNRHYKTNKCMKAREEKSKKQSMSDKEKIIELEKQLALLKDEKEKQAIALQKIIDKKDEFIQSMASRPSTTTTNHNHFNINQYFEGNRGLDFLDNEDRMNERIEHCRMMMESTLENHGLNPMMIEETKKEQCEYLFKDETTGKWNVINTDMARNTFSICKRTDDDKILYVKDPKGKMLKLTVDRVDKDTKKMVYKLSIDQDNLSLDERYVQLEACISASDEKLLTKVPVKSMIDIP